MTTEIRPNGQVSGLCEKANLASRPGSTLRGVKIEGNQRRL